MRVRPPSGSATPRGAAETYCGGGEGFTFPGSQAPGLVSEISLHSGAAPAAE
jgi:hypothetical protein